MRWSSSTPKPRSKRRRVSKRKNSEPPPRQAHNRTSTLDLDGASTLRTQASGMRSRSPLSMDDARSPLSSRSTGTRLAQNSWGHWVAHAQSTPAASTPVPTTSLAHRSTGDKSSSSPKDRLTPKGLTGPFSRKTTTLSGQKLSATGPHAPKSLVALGSWPTSGNNSQTTAFVWGSPLAISLGRTPTDASAATSPTPSPPPHHPSIRATSLGSRRPSTVHGTGRTSG